MSVGLTFSMPSRFDHEPRGGTGPTTCRTPKV